jgi:hypothetical protein
MIAKPHIHSHYKEVKMRIGKVIKRGLLVLLVAAAALGIIAAVLYRQADLAPEDYHPVHLTADEREQTAIRFINKVINGFGNKAEMDEPFEWSLSQDEANRALASMDEIAFQSGQERGKISSQMDRMGVSDPVVTFGKDSVRLMIRSREHDKVLVADLAFRMGPDGALRVRLQQASVGRMAIPQSVVEQQLQSLRDAMAPKPAATSR